MPYCSTLEAAMLKDPQLHALHRCCITGNQQLYGDIYVAFLKNIYALREKLERNNYFKIRPFGA